MTAPTKDTTSVTVQRHIDASPARVYSALTSREELNTWFCNNSFVQARESGHYLFIWTVEQYSATGQFKEVVANEKLVLSWRSTYQGEESDNVETLTITLEEGDGGTTITFVQDGISEESVSGYEYQWNKSLNDLKLYLEKGANPGIVNRVIIGIFPGAVDSEIEEKLGLESGTYSRVTRLVPNFGAEKAGIQVGDIITHMNGVKVGPTAPMFNTVANNKPGDEVEVTLARGEDILTLTMPLTAYPVPEIPESFAALADQLEPEYERVLGQLREIFAGLSEEDASQAPADGEWSAKENLAHLIYTERYNQDVTGSYLANANGRPQHWSGNDATHLGALIAAHSSNDALLAAMQQAVDEQLALWRHFPEDRAAEHKQAIWNNAFGAPQNIQHIESHITQIQEAIEAIKG